MSDEVRPYPFSELFEKQAVTLACGSKEFFGRVGHALDSAALTQEAARNALLAAQAIGRELGHGPASTVLVIQRLRRWMDEGKVTTEQIGAVLDMFDDAEDAGLPPVESAVGEVAPVLKRRLHHVAVQTAMAEYSRRGDFVAVKDVIDKADRLGGEDVSIGTLVGGESFAVISEMQGIPRMQTGGLDLDSDLGGGMPVGGLTVVMGDSGAGKSIMLGHAVAANMRRGALCGYATLELPPGVVLSRINSNLTGIPIRSLLNGKMAEAKARLEAMTNLGPCVVKDFPAMTTTNLEVFEWVKRVEDRYGRKMDLLVFDMMDHITAPAVKDDSTYKVGRAVSAGQHEYAKTSECVVMSASHSKGRKEQKDGKKRNLDLPDVADSIYKVRNADLVLTLNSDEALKEVTIMVAKHRVGRSRMSIPALPTAFECGMLTPVGIIEGREGHAQAKGKAGELGL